MLPNGTKVKIVPSPVNDSPEVKRNAGRVGYTYEGEVMLDRYYGVKVNDNDLQVIENPGSAYVLNGELNVGDYAAWPQRSSSSLYMYYGEVIAIQKVHSETWRGFYMYDRVTIRDKNGKVHRTEMLDRVVKCTST